MKRTVIKNPYPVQFDVDDTLIMHGYPYFEGQKTLLVRDPLSHTESISVTLNEPMIRLLHEELAAGSFVIVHSRGRDGWADAVIEALGIDHPNLLVMTKPLVYFDDKPVQEWLPYRVYIKPDQPYKSRG